jgi:hypothetical protein
MGKIEIGNKNKIKNCDFSQGKTTVTIPVKDSKKKFAEKHPWIAGIIISSIVAFIFLFTFWDKLIKWIEGLF